MSLSIVGTTHIDADEEEVIERNLRRLLVPRAPSKIFFQDRKGTDLTALRMADEISKGITKLIVVTPFERSNLPDENRRIVDERANELVELGLEKDQFESLEERLRYMLERSEKMLAFWRGESHELRISLEIARSLEKTVEEIVLEK